MISGKKILIGITGSISAYKTYTLIRLLVQKGAIIKVVITPNAKDFVAPALLSTFSEHKVYCAYTENDIWQNHVDLGRWADLFVIAPASCNTIAKMANGICDNFFMATYLSATCKVMVLPAMDDEMWHHPSTQKNIQTLVSYNNEIVEPTTGLLASGIIGKGRLPEPEDIVQMIEEKYCRATILAGKTILITAGPTEEPIDPVRVITNRSSGKMGYAIAAQLYLMGANVVLISGPVHIAPAYQGIQLIQVHTASDMFEACLQFSDHYDFGIFCAAVADYTIAVPSASKIKKQSVPPAIELIETKDILAHFGSVKLPHQKIVGFALETNNGLEHAMSKLKNKNADLIVLNTLDSSNTCFNVDEIKVAFIDAQAQVTEFESSSKSTIANHIANYICTNWIQ
jgi:phosphopantothenoylcysteine decarboxylase/phosphopantothenate--cysteine ligase